MGLKFPTFSGQALDFRRFLALCVTRPVTL